MCKNDNSIHFDSNDLKGMKELMDKLGDSTSMFSGENENGETVYISIYHTQIVIKTMQKNHWVRLNTYYRDGSSDETFDGRWE